MFRFQLSSQETFLWHPDIDLFIVISNQKPQNLNKLTESHRLQYIRRLVKVWPRERNERQTLCRTVILKLVMGFGEQRPSQGFRHFIQTIEEDQNVIDDMVQAIEDVYKREMQSLCPFEYQEHGLLELLAKRGRFPPENPRVVNSTRKIWTTPQRHSKRLAIGGLLTPSNYTPSTPATSRVSTSSNSTLSIGYTPIPPPLNGHASGALMTRALLGVPTSPTTSVNPAIPVVQLPSTELLTPVKSASRTTISIIPPPVKHTGADNLMYEMSKAISSCTTPITTPLVKPTTLSTPGSKPITDNCIDSTSQLTRKRRRVITCDSDDDDVPILEGIPRLKKRSAEIQRENLELEQEGGPVEGVG